MHLIGYTDRLSAAPDETIRFMASCDHPSYRADLVRLIHDDENPDGPGFKEREVASPINAEYRGRSQSMHSGSYAIVPDCPAISQIPSFTVATWIYPTTPERGVQGLLTRWSARTEEGFGLFIDEIGNLALWLGNGADRTERICTGTPVRARDWCFVEGCYDSDERRVSLYQSPIRPSPVEGDRIFTEAIATQPFATAEGTPFVMAGCFESRESRRVSTASHFNGKIDRPRLFDRSLTRLQLEALEAGNSPLDFEESLVGAWDFSADFDSDRVTDTSRNELHGRAANMPTRAVTGYNWSGIETDFKRAPEEYGAIYFHDDELVGDFPSLVVNHGPAGYEIDRLDFSLGTPAHALLLASSMNHSALYAAMDDERLAFHRGIDGVAPGSPTEDGKIHPFIRADMVYFENGQRRWSVFDRLNCMDELPFLQPLRQQRFQSHQKRAVAIRIR